MAFSSIGQRVSGLDAAITIDLNARARTTALGRRAIGVLAERLAALEVGLMAALLLGGKRRSVVGMLAAVGLVYVVSEGLGMLWQRERPFVVLTDEVEPLIGHAGGRSFPSRHVASGLAMAAIGQRAHPTLGRMMAVVAGLLGVSRVAAGVHYPSDVAAGALLGYVVGRALRVFMRAG